MGAWWKDQPIGGVWSEEEKEEKHINVLEMMGAQKALTTFIRINPVKSVHLKMDNTTALSYIAKQGGTTNQELILLAKEIWLFLQSKKITLTVEYIPSKINVEADWAARFWRDLSEWKLNPSCFQKICEAFGMPQIDLFASKACHQLPKYMSWKTDPLSIASDALSQDWRFKFLYAFPPFCLIGQCLRKAICHQAKMIIVVPVWSAQPWYPLLLQMAISCPLIFPSRPDLLRSPGGKVTHFWKTPS